MKKNFILAFVCMLVSVGIAWADSNSRILLKEFGGKFDVQALAPVTSKSRNITAAAKGFKCYSSLALNTLQFSVVTTRAADMHLNSSSGPHLPIAANTLTGPFGASRFGDTATDTMKMVCFSNQSAASLHVFGQ